MLATRASRTGALDYAVVTRDDRRTLDKEILVMLDLERELLADTFTMFDLVYSARMPMFAKMFVDTKLPWLFHDGAEDSHKNKKKGVIAQMAGLYDEHKRKKARNKE